MKGPWLHWWKQYFSGIEQQGAQCSGPQWRKTDQVSPMLIWFFSACGHSEGPEAGRGRPAVRLMVALAIVVNWKRHILAGSGKCRVAWSMKTVEVFLSCRDGNQILVRPKWQEFAESQRTGDDVESTRMAWPALPNCLWPVQYRHHKCIAIVPFLSGRLGDDHWPAFLSLSWSKGGILLLGFLQSEFCPNTAQRELGFGVPASQHEATSLSSWSIQRTSEPLHYLVLKTVLGSPQWNFRTHFKRLRLTCMQIKYLPEQNLINSLWRKLARLDTKQYNINSNKHPIKIARHVKKQENVMCKEEKIQSMELDQEWQRWWNCQIKSFKKLLRTYSDP